MIQCPQIHHGNVVLFERLGLFFVFLKKLSRTPQKPDPTWEGKAAISLNPHTVFKCQNRGGRERGAHQSSKAQFPAGLGPTAF